MKNGGKGKAVKVKSIGVKDQQVTFNSEGI